MVGDKADVTNLIGSGIDPHLYTPTRSDVAALMRADVVFYNGLLLEGRMSSALERVSRGDRVVHAVTKLLDPEDLLSPKGAQGHHDPHVWMDVSAWSKAVRVVADEMSTFDPANKDYYQANADAYLEKLAKLDVYVKTAIQSIPEQQRVLITAHDAFNYFGRAYGLKVMGIQGLSTESEAGLADINGLVDYLVDNKIKAIFVESSVADGNVKALVEGAASRGHEVKIGGELFSDAMGMSGTYRGTYIGMIDHNATTIARALAGSAPEGGMDGQLVPH